MRAQPIAIAAPSIGLLTIFASLAGWNRFFEHRKVKFFVDRFGRDAARIF